MEPPLQPVDWILLGPLATQSPEIDLRTGVEFSDTTKILNTLNAFYEAFLNQRLIKRDIFTGSIQ